MASIQILGDPFRMGYMRKLFHLERIKIGHPSVVWYGEELDQAGNYGPNVFFFSLEL